MGNNQAQCATFNPAPYVRGIITQQDVIGLKNVFDSLKPKDGLIQTSLLRRLYRDSHDAPQLDEQIGTLQSLNFDQFYDIMSKEMIQMKLKFKGDVQFDDKAEDVTCLFCPQSRPQSQTL